MLSVIIRYIISTVICAFFITISATQVVLSNLANFDLPPVTFSQRMDATIHDLINFGPIILIIVALAYLIGFLVAWLLAKVCLSNSTWGYIAGLTSVPSAIYLANSFAGIDVIYITQHTSGWFALITGSVLGSMVFYHKRVSQEANTQ